MTNSQTWERLFSHALQLINDVLEHGNKDLFWTFGGGTVLMLRHRHRFSKDIDIFVPDPQALGFVTPRLSDRAESLTSDYTEAANFVKLFLPEGEIDFVAAPNLTDEPFEMLVLLGREVRVETSAEIIAKKFFHRGDRLTARDIFDFALVAEREDEQLVKASTFIARHAALIHEQLERKADMLRMQFEAIDTLDFHPTYDYAVEVLKERLQRYDK